MLDDDKAYFQRRAEAEVKQAQRATSPTVVHAHYILAEAYLRKVASLEQATGELA